MILNIEKKVCITQDTYLNHKVAPFTVKEHIDSAVGLCPNLVPNNGKTKLVPQSKAISFIVL